MTSSSNTQPPDEQFASESSALEDLGIVLIGRNEGDRLIRCLESVVGRASAVVYVDSGSTDGSVSEALRRGVSVIELDLNQPFTAARARNAGFEGLRALKPSLKYVQFLDGDCEVASDWLTRARTELEEKPEAAVVCGRRRECVPEASIYNRLIDMEWDTPIGEAEACGGDALMRVSAFEEVGGFDPTLIAGEEPELCVRLRLQGWRIYRIDAEMTRHDAAMTRFGQWWRRSVRSGHAYAEGAARHGRSPARHWVRQTSSNWFWGLVVPACAIGLAWPTSGLSLALLAGYPLIAYRAARSKRRHGIPTRDAALYGLFCALGKFPQMIGQCKYLLGTLSGRRSTIIEYKKPKPIEAGGKLR